MTELNLNRDRLALLRDLRDGRVIPAENGRHLRRVNGRQKISVNMRHLGDLREAGLVDPDGLNLTDAGREAAK